MLSSCPRSQPVQGEVHQTGKLVTSSSYGCEKGGGRMVRPLEVARRPSEKPAAGALSPLLTALGRLTEVCVSGQGGVLSCVHLGWGVCAWVLPAGALTAPFERVLTGAFAFCWKSSLADVSRTAASVGKIKGREEQPFPP